MTQDREQALVKILQLMRNHGLSQHDIARAEDEAGIATRRSTIAKHVLAYTGGLLIFVGLYHYATMMWQDMSSIVRVLITLAPGIIAQILGVAAAREQRFSHAVTPLLIIAALFQPAGLFTFMSEYFDGNNPLIASMLVWMIMGLQQLLLFARYRSMAYLVFATLFISALFSTTMEKLDFDRDLNMLIIGLSGLFYSYGLSRTGFHRFSPFGYFLYLLAFACGLLYEMVDHGYPLDLLLIPVGATFCYLSVATQSRAMLVASVIASLCYLGYYTEEYFEDILGWPIALILTGFLMIGISGYALKLGRTLRMRKSVS